MRNSREKQHLRNGNKECHKKQNSRQFRATFWIGVRPLRRKVWSQSPSDMFPYFCFKKEKYCRFKYCALHRIFCHKLVHIYICFQYSDIDFHIYRTIQCFVLFFVVFTCFFFFLSLKWVPWECKSTSFHKKQTWGQCVCVSVPVKVKCLWTQQIPNNEREGVRDTHVNYLCRLPVESWHTEDCLGGGSQRVKLKQRYVSRQMEVLHLV